VDHTFPRVLGRRSGESKRMRRTRSWVALEPAGMGAGTGVQSIQKAHALIRLLRGYFPSIKMAPNRPRIGISSKRARRTALFIDGNYSGPSFAEAARACRWSGPSRFEWCVACITRRSPPRRSPRPQRRGPRHRGRILSPQGSPGTAKNSRRQYALCRLVATRLRVSMMRKARAARA
jgi:hypothetical protein